MYLYALQVGNEGLSMFTWTLFSPAEFQAGLHTQMNTTNLQRLSESLLLHVFPSLTVKSQGSYSHII